MDHDHWTLRLLARKAVELGFVGFHLARNDPPDVKKNELKPWQHDSWCIPEVGAEFVAPMEDVLDLYEEAYDPRYPTICFDEKLIHPARRCPCPTEVLTWPARTY